jgi:hypothetical protein
LRARLSRGARATALNLHGAEQHVSSLLALFERVAQPRAVRTDGAESAAASHAAAPTAQLTPP